nr:RNA-directed DNA polymerase, eukaryota, reverse transcriptase zinc-binding domain protein [Tanacetum cinerariifolium]
AMDDLASLVSLIGNLFLMEDGVDKWVWSKDAFGSFKIPRKVNICVWRASIDRLATRLNLVNRGVSIDSDVCPVCEACGESVNYYLLICPKEPKASLDHTHLSTPSSMRKRLPIRETREARSSIALPRGG